jgi:hypothetical protein
VAATTRIAQELSQIYLNMQSKWNDLMDGFDHWANIYHTAMNPAYARHAADKGNAYWNMAQELEIEAVEIINQMQELGYELV